MLFIHCVAIPGWSLACNATFLSDQKLLQIVSHTGENDTCRERHTQTHREGGEVGGKEREKEERQRELRVGKQNKESERKIHSPRSSKQETSKQEMRKSCGGTSTQMIYFSVTVLCTLVKTCILPAK